MGDGEGQVQFQVLTGWYIPVIMVADIGTCGKRNRRTVRTLVHGLSDEWACFTRHFPAVRRWANKSATSTLDLLLNDRIRTA